MRSFTRKEKVRDPVRTKFHFVSVVSRENKEKSHTIEREADQEASSMEKKEKEKKKKSKSLEQNWRWQHLESGPKIPGSLDFGIVILQRNEDVLLLLP